MQQTCEMLTSDPDFPSFTSCPPCEASSINSCLRHEAGIRIHKEDRRYRRSDLIHRQGLCDFAACDGISDAGQKSTSSHKRHLVRHDGHEQNIGIKWQAGHVEDRAGDVFGGHGGLDRHGLFAWGTPCFILAVIGVSALPISIWPQAISNSRPSSAVALVSPVIACLVAVYGAERGRGCERRSNRY